MASVFTQIINGEILAYKVAESNNYIAILDIDPNAEGHVLCIFKKEIDKLFDLEREAYLGLMEFSRKVALAVEKTIPCKRVGMAVVGLEVPHVHVHLIPLNSMEDFQFIKKVKPGAARMQELALAISNRFNDSE